MNFKKFGLLLSTVPFVIACKSNSIAGVYSFQMGKETGTHFGLFLNLKDELYDEEAMEEKDLKEFELSFDFKNGKEEEDDPKIQDIINIFKNKDGKASILGYYKLLDEKNRSGENRLKLGISFGYIVAKIEESIGIELDDDDRREIDKLGDAQIIQKLLYATYKDNLVNIYIPVSAEDALYQLYWYGIDIQLKHTDPSDPESPTELQIVYMEGEDVHEFGTAPTPEDVTKINETYPANHEVFEELDILDIHAEYRSFHQVKMGLTKN